jgi:hypothetical protein
MKSVPRVLRLRCVASISPLVPLTHPSSTHGPPLCPLALPGPRDVILERFVRVLYIRLSDVPCRRHIPYLRRIPLRQRRRVRRPQSRAGT